MTDWWNEFFKVLFSPESFTQAFAGVLVAIIFAALARLFRPLLRNSGLEKTPAPKTYSEQLEKLTNKLSQASTEVDSLLSELTSVANERDIAVQKVESRLKELEKQESQIQKRIQDLKQVPLPVAEHFANLIQTGEKRNALRDYLLFGAGIVVSIIIQALVR